MLNMKQSTAKHLKILKVFTHYSNISKLNITANIATGHFNNSKLLLIILIIAN